MMAWNESFPDFGQTWGESGGYPFGLAHLWCGAVRPKFGRTPWNVRYSLLK